MGNLITPNQEMACAWDSVFFDRGFFFADEVALQQTVKQNDVHDSHDGQANAAQSVENKWNQVFVDQHPFAHPSHHRNTETHKCC